MTPMHLWSEAKSLWPFGMVLLAGIGLHNAPTWMPAHEMVSGPLADATMIAAILGATVDKLAKKELMRELSVDLYFHYTGRSLPTVIKDYIKRALLDTALVATAYELRYAFDHRADDRLDVFVTMRRRIENFSPRKATLQHHTSVFLSEEPEYLEYTLEVEGSKKKSFSWPGAKENGSHVKSERAALVFDAKPTTLAPHGEAGSAATVIRRTKTVFRTTDTDIHAHGKPTCTTTIIVDRKPDWLQFEVDGAECQLGSTWTIDRVMWAHGFRRVRWFDKRERSSGPTRL